MSLEAINKPQIITIKENSVTINWVNVFPQPTDNSYPQKSTLEIRTEVKFKETQPNFERIYELYIQENIEDWRIVYWGRKTETNVSNLQPCRTYLFRLKQIQSREFNKDNCSGESHWLEFKATTGTDQYYVQHLTRAIKCGKTTTIRNIITKRPYLLEAPNLHDKTPLMQAIELNNLNAVNFLCTLGAKVNAQSLAAQQTPLMIALFLGFIDIASKLLEKGALINQVDIIDRTPLHYAIDGDNKDAVKFAIQHGADINARDERGCTPLLRAVILEVQDDIISLLHRKGCDCDAVDQRGLDFRKYLQLTNRTRLLKSVMRTNLVSTII